MPVTAMIMTCDEAAEQVLQRVPSPRCLGQAAGSKNKAQRASMRAAGAKARAGGTTSCVVVLGSLGRDTWVTRRQYGSEYTALWITVRQRLDRRTLLENEHQCGSQGKLTPKAQEKQR